MSDVEARQRAASDFDTNLVVVASAGTGKTSLLVERLLNQLVGGGLEVDRFAAITFTERAAGEMRRRLDDGLDDLARAARSGAEAAIDSHDSALRALAFLRQRLADDTIAQRAERARADLPRATLTTIHGFCARLLRSVPIAAGTDPAFRVDDGAGVARAVRRVWRDFLEGDAGPEGNDAAAWREVLARFDVDELEAIAVRFARWEIAGDCDPADIPDAQTTLGETFGHFVASIDKIVGADAKPGPEDYLALARRALIALKEDGLDQARETLISGTFRNARGTRAFVGADAPKSNKLPEATALAAELKPLLARLIRADDTAFRRALSCLRPFVSLARAELRRIGLLPFDALLALTRDVLTHDPVARRRIADRYDLLCVDEFQDTDPLQYEIVFLLAEAPGDEPTADAWTARLEAGKLFIVGDPKQAIYRFRGADIDAYQRAVGHVLENGGALLALTTTWRAVPEIVEPLDRLFTALFAEGGAAQVDYDGMTSGRPPAGDGARIELLCVGPDAKRNADTARREEADALAARLRAGLDADEFVAGDIAILLGALTFAPTYARALSEWGVPNRIESPRDVLARPEGQMLRALLACADDPSNEAALLAVLRSPLGGVTDAELARWAASRDRGRWSYTRAQPDRGAFPNVARTFGWLCERRRALAARPLDRWLGELLDTEPLVALCRAARDGAQRAAVLRALVEPLIVSAATSPGATLGELRERLDGLAPAALRPGVADDDCAVRLMTMHGAKGLEFPIVVLPDLSRSYTQGPPPPPVELAELRPHGLALSTRAGTTASWVRHLHEEKVHAEAESRRLFYVACTRARERLVLVHAGRKVEQSPYHRFLAPWGYSGAPSGPDKLPAIAGVDVHWLEPPPPPAPGPELALGAIAPVEVGVDRARDIAERAHTRLSRTLRSPSGLREDAERAEAAVPERPSAARMAAAERARRVGTALHEILERWDFTDPAAARALLSTTGLRGEDHAAAAALVERLVGGPLPSYLAALDVVGREVPVLYREADGVTWTGTVDLLYRDNRGRLVVADYKTDTPKAARTAAYRPQLETYGRGIARAFPDEAPPALELIYIRTGERVRL